MRISHIRKADSAGFFYLWVVGTSEASFATILDLQRTLFYDLRNFNYSEIAALPLSELYVLTISGPHKRKDGDGAAANDGKAAAKRSIDALKKLGLG